MPLQVQLFLLLYLQAKQNLWIIKKDNFSWEKQCFAGGDLNLDHVVGAHNLTGISCYDEYIGRIKAGSKLFLSFIPSIECLIP